MMKSVFTSLALIGMSITGALGFERSANTIILDEAGVRNLGIEYAWVEPRDFESTLFAIGRIEEIPQNHSVLSTRVAGRVKAIHAFEGDFVKKGDPIAEIETRQLGDPPPSATLTAPQDGLVTKSHLRLGQPVEPSAELMDFSDRSTVWAVAKIPEQAAGAVEVGSLARIRIPALGAVTIDAKLLRFGVTADRDSGTIEAIFELPNEAGRLRPGLRVEFAVVTARQSRVLSVPRASVQGDPSARVVFIKDFDLENAFVRVPVVLGARNDRYVEVLSGLFEGDEVVTEGAYSLMFAGGGQQISLKEALDAAHGHEHNEDGSEITPEQRAEKEHSHADEHGHGDHDDHEAHGPSWVLLIYAGAMTFLSVVLLQQLLNRKRTSKEAVTDAE